MFWIGLGLSLAAGGAAAAAIISSTPLIDATVLDEATDLE